MTGDPINSSDVCFSHAHYKQRWHLALRFWSCPCPSSERNSNSGNNSGDNKLREHWLRPLKVDAEVEMGCINCSGGDNASVTWAVWRGELQNVSVAGRAATQLLVLLLTWVVSTSVKDSFCPLRCEPVLHFRRKINCCLNYVRPGARSSWTNKLAG